MTRISPLIPLALTTLLFSACMRQEATVIEGPIVEDVARIQLEGFSVDAQEFVEAGETLYILDYSTPEDAQADAEKIATDGSSIADIALVWQQPPHFFLNGTRMVIYTGTRADIIANLETGAGAQFAGAQ